jgi:hypothetical protein
MGRFRHSKKAHSEGEGKKNSKFTISKIGNKKLEDYFVHTQKHRNIWNSFCHFLDERFAEEDLSEILDAEEISRLKIPPIIPAHLEFNECRRSRIRRKEKSQKLSAISRRQILREQRSLLSGRTQEVKTKIQQSNSSSSETCRCADQLRSPSISKVRSNQETGAGSQI